MKRALIVQGGWPGHKPEAFSDRVATHLRACEFDVRVEDTTEVLGDVALLARCDLIVPNWTMGALDEEHERHLLEAVRAGNGLGGWHGGMGDAFRASLMYKMMVGGQFVSHPGNVRNYRVRITDRDHPITRGVEDFDIESEQYYLHVDPSNHVLADTTFDGRVLPWIDGVTMPVAWTRSWGAGRVFYLAVGHAPHEFDIPEVWTMLTRGLAWATRGAGS
jgi:type 1 glutamine amidotransferase